jgi:hypothetical protein
MFCSAVVLASGAAPSDAQKLVLAALSLAADVALF